MNAFSPPLSEKRPPRLRLAAAFCTLLFIFSNSLLSREASGEVSGFVDRLIRPLVDTVFYPLTAGKSAVDVRKLAHFTEFFLLGFALKGCSKPAGCLLLICLAACLDEWLQSYTGRAPLLRDVLIDVTGGFAGFQFAWMGDVFLDCLREEDFHA